MTLWSSFFDLLGTWGSLFIAPLKDLNMLWIIIPVYLAWIFTEFYQEKKGTSLGNAISNGVVVLWAGIDWARQIVSQLAQKTLLVSVDFFAKMFLAILVFIYGIMIIVEGTKGKKITMFIGRIREVTYVVLMLTPIFYGVVQFSFKVMFAIILFFPLFYGIVEIIDRVTPTPKTYEEEKEFEKEREEKQKEKGLKL